MGNESGGWEKIVGELVAKIGAAAIWFFCAVIVCWLVFNKIIVDMAGFEKIKFWDLAGILASLRMLASLLTVKR